MLPIICLIYLKNTNAFEHFGVIEISFPDKGLTENNINVKRYLNSKKYFIVNFTGDNKTDKLKIENAKILIEKIIITKDSIQGVKFNFTKSEYWTFIKILDILSKNNAQLFSVYNNELWFANPQIRTFETITKNMNSNRNYMNCGTQYVNNKVQDEENYKIENIGIREIIKNYYPSIIAYLLMIFFTIKSYKQKVE